MGPLSAALAAEGDPAVRAAIVEALETIAPGTPPVLESHQRALRDPDPLVRAAGARFQDVPADDAMVTALAAALIDPSEDVRGRVAGSMTQVLFESPRVVPALLEALRDSAARPTVVESLRIHLRNTSEEAEFSRFRGKLPKLTATLGAVIPELAQALSRNDPESSAAVFGLLGRIVAFTRLSRDEGLRKCIEPAVETYLHGLNDSDPAVREEVLSRVGKVPIRRAEIIAALEKFLERTDQPNAERETARLAIKAQRTASASPAGPASTKN